ncbi:hypothetical protein [Nocardia sp. BMG111209]|uniref:hypothetical protein n=1 Tax=Nocardia sp. BMG111209 TaxID=1160137 RepID=UPI0003693778|nr:hypothetical protein [Nocardia sp. BMG111209]
MTDISPYGIDHDSATCADRMWRSSPHRVAGPPCDPRLVQSLLVQRAYFWFTKPAPGGPVGESR